jgi:3-oxoacyl-(acyl-carrier-protein) reductase
MKTLKGKVALVTGGSRGIGRAICLALAEAGAEVAVNYSHSPDAAEETAAQCAALGVRSQIYKADVSNEQDVQEMAGKILADLGTVQVLVNNAGITRDKSFLKMTRGMWDEVLAINLTGPFLVTHALLGPMVESGWGRIINLSSVVGQEGNFGQANYAATKGGVISFTMTLARELARKNITVNAIAPGFIETDMTKAVPDVVKDQVRAITPVGRLGMPEEVAAAAAFLASPQAAYITGQVIAVNGGMYM